MTTIIAANNWAKWDAEHRVGVDLLAATKGPGADWRAKRTPDEEKMLKAWEDSPRKSGLRGSVKFKKLISSAPEVNQPVFRGEDIPGAYGYKSNYEKHFKPGDVVNFPRASSASTRAEVAGGFGRVLYEVRGTKTRGIGNTLHEVVMPRGKFKVVSVSSSDDAISRAIIDGKTVSPSYQLHVVLEPVDTGLTAANNWAEWDAEHPYIPHPRTRKIELFTPHGEYKDAQEFSETIRAVPTEAFKKKYGWNPIDAESLPETKLTQFFDAPPTPLKAWGLYQMAGAYNEINDALRGHPHPYTDYDGTNLAKKIPAAFHQYAKPTTDNFSFYRGVKNRAGFDISQFQVGSVFEEKGVVSTSPDFNEVLAFEADNRTIEQGNMAVIELQTPKGTKVLGGMEGSIEVMMAPGTKYKVTDVKKDEHIGDYTQADGTRIKGGTITYVTAEVLP